MDIELSNFFSSHLPLFVRVSEPGAPLLVRMFRWYGRGLHGARAAKAGHVVEQSIVVEKEADEFKGKYSKNLRERKSN
jgi:hypothetical protein